MSALLKNKIIRNTLSCCSSSCVSIAINLLLMPFMISRLGVVEYGLIGISAIFMMGGCISLLELGLHTSISKFVAEYNAIENHVKINGVICTSMVLFLAIGLILMAIGCLLSGVIVSNLLKIPHEYQSSFKAVLLIIFGSYIFQFPNFVTTGFLSGMQRFDILKGVQVITTILYAGGVIFLLLSGHDYFSVIVCQICVLFLQFCCYLVITLRQTNFSIFKLSNYSIRSMGDVFKMTKYLFVNKVSALIFYNTPRIIISIFLGPIFMTSYEAVVKISRAIKAALGFINSAIMPAASELYANKKLDIIKKLFLKTCRYQIFAIFPVVTGVMFLAKDFYQIWLGSDFIKLAPLLWIALLWNILTPFITTGGAIMLGMNKKLKSIAALSVATTLLTICTILLLLRKYQLAGVIVGPTLSTFIVLPFYLNIYFKELEIKTAAFIKEVFIVALFGLIPLAVGLIINKFDFSNSYYTLASRGLVWCLSYWALLYIFVLDNEDRGLLGGLTEKFTKVKKNTGNLNEVIE